MASKKGGEKRKREEKKEGKAKKPAKGGAAEEEKESARDSGPKKIKLEVMLAHVFDPEKHDPTGWWMSEKLDGVRAYWSGANMYSRAGNKFYAPSYFKDALPKGVELDGELWTKRDDFQKCVSIVKRQDYNDEWKTLTYMVFDAPGLKGKNFTERLAKLKEIIGEQKSSYLKLHEHVICKTPEQLMEATDKVIEKGGEGMMLRDPESMYERKRSFALLKVKKFEDAEATVIGHEDGKGRLTGLIGALVVKEKDGTTFQIGSGFNDKQRTAGNIPKIGTQVTFKFQGRSKQGVPRFPIFLREYVPL